MQKPLPNRSIMCIDMKCFYASCIAMLERLDVMKVPIAVIANSQQPGSVVLATSYTEAGTALERNRLVVGHLA